MSTIFKKQADSERNSNASLYFGNIDPQITELLMYELFIQFGPIKSLNMPKDRILKTHQGYGFVEFRNIDDAKYTMDILRGVRLYGKALKLKKIDAKSSTSTTGNRVLNQTIGTFVASDLINSNYIDVGAEVFISNLNPLIDEKFLSDTFSKFGKLIRTPSIRRDPEGQSMGYAFLTYDDFESSDLCIQKMNNVILMNNKISVSYAFKDQSVDGKKVRHGDEVERMLAQSAKKNNLLVTKKTKKGGKPHKITKKS
ncbi:Splicing factor 3B subunit 4 [Candida viswanathii]|uniref:Splicing factor 3B subunit 4 n=1 Tax=Candida viswanathii TaxID=5486 RepID=A0A367XLH8_9ASCO|nr:Splicing factor 3B subunit 4 [Candida viswanathii]